MARDRGGARAHRDLPFPLDGLIGGCSRAVVEWRSGVRPMARPTAVDPGGCVVVVAGEAVWFGAGESRP